MNTICIPCKAINESIANEEIYSERLLIQANPLMIPSSAISYQSLEIGHRLLVRAVRRHLRVATETSSLPPIYRNSKTRKQRLSSSLITNIQPHFII
jgi:hypothetical protein